MALLAAGALVLALNFTGVRGVALVLLFVPVVYLLIEKQLRAMFPDAVGEEDRAHGRDYYVGYVVGRTSLKQAQDVDDLVRLLRTESYHFQLQKDDGGEKVFLARTLPGTRGVSHDIEAGLLSGGLFRATGTRFEVEEDRCASRGEGYCRFVAIRG